MLVTVDSIIMPNLLTGETVYPEFIQGAATPGALARAALELLRDQNRRARVKARLAEVITSLGPPGACQRAAQAILELPPARI
jgi:lipid-A-disaccharide synthase